MQDVMAVEAPSATRCRPPFKTYYLAQLQINMHQTSRMILNTRLMLTFGMQDVMAVVTPSVTRCRPPFMTNYLAPNQSNWHQILRMLINTRSLLTFWNARCNGGRDTKRNSVSTSMHDRLSRSKPHEQAPNFANDVKYFITAYVWNARCNGGRDTKRNSVSTSIQDQLSRSTPNEVAPNLANDN